MSEERINLQDFNNKKSLVFGYGASRVMREVVSRVAEQEFRAGQIEAAARKFYPDVEIPENMAGIVLRDLYNKGFLERRMQGKIFFYKTKGEFLTQPDKEDV